MSVIIITKLWTNRFFFCTSFLYFTEDLSTSISVSNCQIQENVVSKHYS